LGLAQRLQESEALKAAGTERFKAGDVLEAIELYSRATELVRDSPAGDARDDALAVLLANRSACHLKTTAREAADLALEDAMEASRLRPKYAKALYRMGLAQQALGQHADAAQSFWSAYEAAPNDAGAPALFQLFQKAVKMAKEEEQAKKQPSSAQAGFKHNVPVEVPTDGSPNAPLKSLVLSFNDGEAPAMVAGRFIQTNHLDPSLLTRIAHHVDQYVRELNS
jgi:tetratricopeptide (TPR) repeat protein